MIAKNKKSSAQLQPKPPFPKQHQKTPGLESKLTPAPRYLAPLYKPADKLLDKVALITGGDSGIGRAVAVIYAREGADVALVYLPVEQSDAEVTRDAVVAAGRKCILIPGDLTDAKFCRTCVDQTVKKLGKLDILVSNAAHQNRKETIEEITDEEFDETFKTNVYAYFWLVRAALPHLKSGAAIIATSSENAFEPSKNLPDYAATKAAIVSLTKTFAQLLIEKGIRVNSVAPGPVWTPLNPSDQGQSAKKVSQFGKQQPIKRPAQPEEIAPAYVFLASDADSSYISGSVIAEVGALPISAV